MTVRLGVPGADKTGGGGLARSFPLSRSSLSAEGRRDCHAARKALRWYVGHAARWNVKRGGPKLEVRAEISSCPKWLARLWRTKARAARQAWERFRTLEDTPSWQEAIRRVQRVFPNTAAWLDSCSDAEGMSPSRDREFYVYGFKPFSWLAWHSNTVGGPMQMRPGTFIYFYNRGRDSALARGFRIPAELREANARSWRSMLAQAIAGGYARWSGRDGTHWIASWANGCR